MVLVVLAFGGISLCCLHKLSHSHIYVCIHEYNVLEHNVVRYNVESIVYIKLSYIGS